MAKLEEALAATAAAPDRQGDLAATVDAPTVMKTARSAVLPRSGDASALAGERYARKQMLGVGGMGEVVLAEDRDIGRHVAVKFLTAPSSDEAALARFVDEIRVVGSLEHPNIVPIHDVGVDEANRFYFVMKHVEGETLESVIEKLRSGDPKYHARYTYTARVEIFVALLHALAFAHSRGYVHRDIKPANAMIGRFGEVLLMDWGVAKQARTPEPAASESDGGADDAKPLRERLFTTRRGAIVGTPYYMSPEQARGDVDAIDERSDVYCATVLFYELVTLQHYLGEPESLATLLAAIQHEEPRLSFGALTHPTQGPPLAEFIHFVKKGLKKNPAERYQSVGEMIDILEGALDGRVRVQCPFTAQKRFTRELSRFVDRRPVLALFTFLSGAAGFAAVVVRAVVAVLHAH